MSKLTLSQEWLLHNEQINQTPLPGPLPPEPSLPELKASFFVTCNDGALFSETFEAPDYQEGSIEVNDGAGCTIKHTIASSAVETESTCKNNINIMEDTHCAYTSVIFDESIPTLELSGIITLILGIAVLTLLAIKRYA